MIYCLFSQVPPSRSAFLLHFLKKIIADDLRRMEKRNHANIALTVRHTTSPFYKHWWSMSVLSPWNISTSMQVETHLQSFIMKLVCKSKMLPPKIGVIRMSLSFKDISIIRRDYLFSQYKIIFYGSQINFWTNLYMVFLHCDQMRIYNYSLYLNVNSGDRCVCITCMV